MSHDSFLDCSLGEFLDRAGERAPTPGGGSVAALSAALAVSMARMVLAYSHGRKAVADCRATLQELVGLLGALDRRARAAVDADAEAYRTYDEAVQAAGRMDTPEVREALWRAVEVPLEVIAVCDELTDLLLRFNVLFNPRLRSDLLVACHLARAAGHAARENVEVNLTGLGDDPRIAAARERCREQLEAVLSRAGQIESAAS